MDERVAHELGRGLQHIERGVLNPTHEELAVHLDSAGRLRGEAAVQGVVREEATEIPFLLHPGFIVPTLAVNGNAAALTGSSTVLHHIRLPRPLAWGQPLAIRVRYCGQYAFGSRKTAAGERWSEFNLNTLWRPLFSLDLRDGARFRISASLPGRLRVVAAIANGSACIAAKETVCAWDTGTDTSIDFSFVAGDGEYAERSVGGMVFRALTMRGVPYSPADVIALAGEIVSRYESLWGPCPFRELSLACPPGSVTGDCAREGLIIAGSVGESDLRDSFGMLAHEIAHQWWGLGVRFDPTRPGLAEGLAAYAALVADRVRLGAPAVRTAVAEEYLPWAREAETDGTALLDCTWFQPHSQALRVGKGACVFLLLERALGEDGMAAALRDFAARFRGRPVTPEDLRTALVAFGGNDVSQLWDRYVAGTEPLPHEIERYVR